MKTSDNGLKIIKKNEGLRLNSYKCPAGILTIGYGHTGKDVLPGMEINETYADFLLKTDVMAFESLVSDRVKVPITQNQFDALVSLTYNIGQGNFSKSTLLKKLNAGDHQGAALEFIKWNKATVNGVLTELPGLTKRRSEEKELFLKGLAS